MKKKLYKTFLAITWVQVGLSAPIFVCLSCFEKIVYKSLLFCVIKSNKSTIIVFRVEKIVLRAINVAKNQKCAMVK